MAKKIKRTRALTTAKKRLDLAREIAEDASVVLIRRDFIDKFTLCDITCKTILEYYAEAKKIDKQGKFINLNVQKISAAMHLFDLDIPRHVLSGVFGGSKQYRKRNSKSAKKLRDGIVHAMSKEDIQEVVQRNEELNTLMDSFLAYF